MAMFPPALPHVFIRWLTEAGEVVYDPFSGRGTTPLEACLLERRGFGSDANPLAWVLTAAKVDPPKRRTLDRRLSELEASVKSLDPKREPPHIRMLFDDHTLGQLLWLRQHLDLSQRTDRFLMATLVGIMHGNRTKDGKPTGFTIPMPNTFSMAPGYVERFIREHRLRPPRLDVLPFLQHRVDHLPLPDGNFVRGRAWRHNITHHLRGPVVIEPAKLIFTSPPYLRVTKYGQYNWVRLWMLGASPTDVDRALFTSESVTRYLKFMTQAVASMRPALRDDGYLCLVVGDVRKEDEETNLARALVGELTRATDLRLLGTVVDRLPVQHKVSRIWGETRGRATRTDRILILAGPKTLPPGPLEPMTWRRPNGINGRG